MLEIKDLHASINGKEILKGINLTVNPGEVHAIMGPNGSFVIYNTKESTDTYELGNQKESSSKGRNFKEERDLVYPIPTTEISQSNGSIVQNPGYN